MFAREKKGKKRERKRERYIENERRWKSWSSVLRNRVWRSPAIIASRELSSNYRWARLNVRSALSPRDRQCRADEQFQCRVYGIRRRIRRLAPIGYVCVCIYVWFATISLFLSLLLSPFTFSLLSLSRVRRNFAAELWNHLTKKRLMAPNSSKVCTLRESVF